MNTKIINGILIGVIAVVIAVIGFFAWRVFFGDTTPGSQQQPGSERIFPEPTPITNKGKESEDRDAALERDIRIINDAVVAYATDHAGKYPESDFKNPCTGVRYCLKGVNINTGEKAYLPVIPQIAPDNSDYHYRADNKKKSYCIVTPSVLETDTAKVFQCTEGGCGRIPLEDQCQ